jgi:hypothetical protein
MEEKEKKKSAKRGYLKLTPVGLHEKNEDN